MSNDDIPYGVVRNAAALGRLVRAHRKSRGLGLEKVGGIANLGTRFLSEFERGKETAEIGKVFKALQTLGLEVVIQPRAGRVIADSKNPVSSSTEGTTRNKGR